MVVDSSSSIHTMPTVKSSFLWADELQKGIPLFRLEHRLPGHYSNGVRDPDGCQPLSQVILNSRDCMGPVLGGLGLKDVEGCPEVSLHLFSQSPPPHPLGLWCCPALSTVLWHLKTGLSLDFLEEYGSCWREASTELQQLWSSNLLLALPVLCCPSRKQPPISMSS